MIYIKQFEPPANWNLHFKLIMHSKPPMRSGWPLWGTLYAKVVRETKNNRATPKEAVVVLTNRSY